MNFSAISLLIFILLSLARVCAQKGELDSKEIIIEKDRKIELPETERIFEKINFDVPREQYPELEYDFKNEPSVKFNELNPKLKAQAIKDSEMLEGKKGKVTYGLGNYFANHLAFDYGEKLNQNSSYNIFWNHQSFQRGPVEGKKSGSSSNTVEGNINYFLKQGKVAATVGVDREVVRYYGYDQSLYNPQDDQLRLISPLFYTIFHNTLCTKDTQTILTSNFKFYHLTLSRIANRESEIIANQQGYTYLKPDLCLKWDFEGSYILRTILQNNVKRHYIQSSISLLKKLNLITVEGGIRFASSADTIQTAKKLYFYPIANIQYDLIPQAIGLEISYEGSLQKNNLRTFTRSILWLDTHVVVQHNNIKHKIQGTVKTNISHTLYTTLGFQYHKLDNYHFFVNNFVKREFFMSVYDKHLSITNILAEIGFLRERIRTSLIGKYAIVKNKLLDAPYHFPQFQANWNTRLAFASKLFFTCDAYVLGGIHYLDIYTNKTKSLSDILDINVKTEYFFSNNFGIFCKFDNILSQKYERFRYYTVRGFQVQMGIHALF